MKDTFALVESSLAGTSLRRSIMRCQGKKRSQRDPLPLSNAVSCDLKRSSRKANVSFWTTTSAMSILMIRNIKRIENGRGRHEKKEKRRREPRERLMRKLPRRRN